MAGVFSKVDNLSMLSAALPSSYQIAPIPCFGDCGYEFR